MITVKLKEIREKRKMKVCEMSDFLGLKHAYGYYSYLEHGKKIPRVDRAIEIASKLKLKVTDIWVINK